MRSPSCWRLPRSLGFGLGASFVLLACNQLMGIEDAHVDPLLESTDGTGTITTTANAGGSSGDANATSSQTQSSTSSGGTDNGTSGSLGQAGETSESSSDSTGTETSGAGGNASSASTSAGTDGEPDVVSLCDSYCDDVTEACTGTQAQYRDRAQCMEVCSMFDEGTLGKVNENTVACRAKYAGDARYSNGTELAAYCRRAGPGGAGYCGSDCTGFCTIMMQVCSGPDVGVYQFQTDDACLEACEALPVSESAYSVNDPLVADGNHVQCRLFHVTSAAMLDPEEHCEHAMGVTLCEALDE